MTRFVARPREGASSAMELSEAAFKWLAASSRSPAVQRLDPYRDSAFSGGDLLARLTAVQTTLDDQAQKARERLLKTAKLPQNASVRERVLLDLVQRTLDDDDVARGLRQLHSFLKLASEASAIVHVEGD
jgi:hypothetical protein